MEVLMKVEAYLNFDGRCEEAVEFYRKNLGAKVIMMMRFKESPDPSAVAPGSENKIMHTSLKMGESTIYGSDGRCTNSGQKFTGISLSLGVETPTEADRCFTALAEGGQVHMPLQETFYSPSFGMVSDRFGVMWMVIAAARGGNP
jgi:PhnB protein